MPQDAAEAPKVAGPLAVSPTLHGNMVAWHLQKVQHTVKAIVVLHCAYLLCSLASLGLVSHCYTMQAIAVNNVTLPAGVQVLACADAHTDACQAGLYMGTSHGVYCIP